MLDCGVKYNILRKLLENKCQVKLYLLNKANEILKMKPDGLLLSTVQEIRAVNYVIETTRRLIKNSHIWHLFGASDVRLVWW